MKRYSQNLEQEAILDYFNGAQGTFIDIGANDGETFSNTRALALTGFTGILIEPSPKAFAKLKKLYDGHKDIKIYQYAIGSHNGKAMLQESGPLCSAEDIGLVSTFHQHEKERFQRTVKYDPIEVKVYRWKTALNRWQIKEFDCISIDCEGCDLAILLQMDLSKTKLVIVEWNGKQELKAEFDKVMEGFKVIYTSGENLVYAR